MYVQRVEKVSVSLCLFADVKSYFRKTIPTKQRWHWPNYFPIFWSRVPFLVFPALSKTPFGEGLISLHSCLLKVLLFSGKLDTPLEQRLIDCEKALLNTLELGANMPTDFMQNPDINPRSMEILSKMELLSLIHI